MPALAFEDFTPGASATFGDVVIDRDEIVAFARQYDPQPFHLGEEEAKGTFVGELIASGWHSCGLQMRMICDAVFADSTALGAPGLEQLKWIAPVRPGDRLSVTQTVLDARRSTSRPDIGLVRFRQELRNAPGELKVEQTNWVIFAVRAAAGKVGPNPSSLPKRKAEAGTEPGDATSPPLLVRFADDLRPGMSTSLGAYTFTAEDIVAYARRFDPQSFHLDPEAARNSLFGGLCASGWHTGSIWCKRLTEARSAEAAAARARGEPVPQFGSSPGFRDLKWLKPVFAGDTISYRSVVVEARPSRSRPGWAIVLHDNFGDNQHGETVFSLRATSFWSRSSQPTLP